LPGGSAVAERPSDAATVQSGMRRVAELGAQLDPQGTQALVRDLAGFGQALLEAMAQPEAQPEALPNRWGTQLPLRRTAAEALAQLPDTMGAHEAAQVGDTSDKSDEMRTAPPPLAKPSRREPLRAPVSPSGRGSLGGRDGRAAGAASGGGSRRARGGRRG
jgi:hypothetical protein